MMTTTTTRTRTRTMTMMMMIMTILTMPINLKILSVTMTCFPNAFLFHSIVRILYKCVKTFKFIFSIHTCTYKKMVCSNHWIESNPNPTEQKDAKSPCFHPFFQATRCYTEISSNQRLYHVHVPAPNHKSSTDQSASLPWQGHNRKPSQQL